MPCFVMPQQLGPCPSLRLTVHVCRLVEYDVEEVLLILHVLLGGVLAPTFTTFCPKVHCVRVSCHCFSLF